MGAGVSEGRSDLKAVTIIQYNSTHPLTGTVSDAPHEGHGAVGVTEVMSTVFRREECMDWGLESVVS